MSRLNLVTSALALAALTLVASGPLAAQAAGAAGPTSPAGKQVIGRGSATLSPAVRVGNLLFMSGQLPSGPDTTIQGQTKSTLEKMKPILELAGARVEDIVKCTVFLIDGADFAGMNQAYREFFPSEPPARSTVVVAALVQRNAKLEIECIAAVK